MEMEENMLNEYIIKDNVCTVYSEEIENEISSFKKLLECGEIVNARKGTIHSVILVQFIIHDIMICVNNQP